MLKAFRIYISCVYNQHIYRIPLINIFHILESLVKYKQKILELHQYNYIKSDSLLCNNIDPNEIL